MCFILTTAGPELDPHCPPLHAHSEALGGIWSWKNQVWSREYNFRTRPTDRAHYLLVTSLPHDS